MPARHKLDAPRYQSLARERIPSVALPNRQATVRIIARQFDGHCGAALTHTPINLWEVRLPQRAQPRFVLPEGHTLMLLVERLGRGAWP